MLKHRIIFGTILAAVALGILGIDGWFAPYFPILFAATIFMGVLTSREIVGMMPTATRPRPPIVMGLVLMVIAANWLPPFIRSLSPAVAVGTAFLAALLIVFLFEMATYREPGGHVERMSLTLFAVAYLGLLASCFVQIRWLNQEAGSSILLMTIFIPKFGDIGAYAFGNLFGKRKMTPLLSPKKTWEGFAGGLLGSVAAAVIVHAWQGPFRFGYAEAVGFGLVLSVAGMLGDLAESLIKRDAGIKDAARSIPGFGGLLDVVDSVLFAAPIALAWFTIAVMK